MLLKLGGLIENNHKRDEKKSMDKLIAQGMRFGKDLHSFKALLIINLINIYVST